MNVPNKITLCRIFLSIVLMVLMIFPVEKVSFDFPELTIKELLIDSKYLICGVIFLIASLTDFIDGFLARKYNLVTDTGKIMDAIADKILVNGVLVIFASIGFISVIVPVVIVCRDIAVDSIKMVAGSKNGAVAASKTGKLKTACMMSGITLLFFYNLPFSLFGINKVAEVLIMIACILSVISGVEYYNKNKKYIVNSK